MKNRLLIPIILILLLISCQRTVQQDQSFTLEEYQKRGIPELDLSWEIEDYELVYEQLSKIKFQQAMSLPRKDSKKSGMLFDRLISGENLAFVDNDSIPLADKVFRIRYFGDFMDDLIYIYTDIFSREQYYNVELTYLYAAKLAVGEKMMDLAKRILSSESEDDRSYVSGLEAIRYIYLNKLHFVMEKQQFRSLYSKKEYRMLCDSVAAALNRNMEWFDAEMASKMAQQLQLVTDSVDIPAVHRQYQEILNNLGELIPDV